MTTDPKVFTQHLANCRLDICDYQTIVQNIQVVRQRGKYVVDDRGVIPNGLTQLVRDMVKEKFCKLHGYGAKQCHELLVALFGNLEELILNGPHAMLRQHLKRRYETRFPDVGEIIEFSKDTDLTNNETERSIPLWTESVVENRDCETGRVWVKAKNDTQILDLWTDIRLRWRYFKTKGEEDFVVVHSQKTLERMEEKQIPKQTGHEQTCSICLEELLCCRALGPCPHTGICAKCVLRQFNTRKSKQCPQCEAD
jgi:hypothetical protein